MLWIIYKLNIWFVPPTVNFKNLDIFEDILKFWLLFFIPILVVNKKRYFWGKHDQNIYFIKES